MGTQYYMPIVSQGAFLTGAKSWNNHSNSLISADSDANKTISKNVAGGAAASVWDLFDITLTNAPGAGKSWLFEFYVNEVATGVSITIADLAVTGSDHAHTVTINPGDRYQWLATPSGTPAAHGVIQKMVRITCVTAFCQLLSLPSNNSALETASSTTYLALDMRGTQVNLAQDLAQYLWPVDSDFGYLYADAETDPGNGKTAVITFQVAGADTTLTCTITGNGSTNKTASDVDPTHVQSVPANTLVNLKIVMAAGATSTRIRIGMQAIHTIDGEICYQHEGGTATSQFINGEAVSTSSDSAPMVMPACTVSKLYVRTNVGNSPAVGQTLIAAIQRNQLGTTGITTTLNGAGTGVSVNGHDTTHTQVYAAGDNMSTKFTSSSGVIVYKAYLVMTFTQGAGGGNVYSQLERSNVPTRGVLRGVYAAFVDKLRSRVRRHHGRIPQKV